MGSLIDKEKLKARILQEIKSNKFIFIEDICAKVGISKPTFYSKFAIDTDDFNEISNLLEQNKIDIKVSIRKKWHDRQSDTGLMALYKLCSTKEEHRLLQQNYIDYNTTVNPATIDEIEVKVSNEATSN